MIVDDESTVRQAIKRLLEHAGYEVEAVDGGHAALAAISERAYDLVITDFSMPGMSGDQLVTQIRERLPSQRIIMATAFVEEYKVFGQHSANVDALLLKPFSLKELHEAIAWVMKPKGETQANVLPPNAGQTPKVIRPSSEA